MTRRVLKMAVGALVALALGSGVFAGAAGASDTPPSVFPPSPALPPRNDLFVNAVTLSPDPTVFNISPVAGDIRNATPERGEPGVVGPASHSVWYRWTAPRSGVVEFNTCNSHFDTVLGAYRGTAVNALTPAGPDARNDDAAVPCGSTFPLSLNSRVTFPAVAGTTYRIAVDGFFAEGFINTSAFFLNYRYVPVQNGTAAR